MANYFNPGSMDPYAGASPNAQYELTSDPGRLAAQLQNRQLALQGYQSGLAEQQAGAQEAIQRAQEFQAGAPGRMAGIEATNAAMQNPQFAALKGQEIYNQLQGNIGGGAEKYLTAQSPAVQNYLGGAVNTGDQASYTAGLNQMKNLGLDTSAFPSDVTQGKEYLKGIGQAYQFNPQEEAHMAGISAMVGSREKIAADRNAAQIQMNNARIHGAMQRAEVPKSIQAGLVQAQQRGDADEVERLLRIAEQIPQVNPAVQGGIAEAKRSPAQQMIEDRIAGIQQPQSQAEIDGYKPNVHFRWHGKLYYK